MAAIRAIQQTSVHQIQSGQVIVDLNSVVKELVENSLDAGATSIEVRFRNHGLDAVEVVDNGSGIAPEDYGSVALKHHTSKLKSYQDLEDLNTFGFRGEALASLCALSQLYIITARDVDAPKGRKLDFEMSGKLKDTSIVAAQKGTKVVVEKLFYNLPVRKKELEKNIKREYAKVLSLLQAYACISTNVRFVVSNQMAKASKNVAFSTSINNNTKDNITNVFGVKTLHALVKLDLTLEMNPSKPGPATQAARIQSTQPDMASRDVVVQGHISRPVSGEGRQAPDRQFFFVNSRPCGLPQVAKAFNEVYKSFNVSQSPFIFANLVMDTHAYDVNVSPDKRTILLHDQSELLESLKAALHDLFGSHEQSVPHSKLASVTQVKLPSYKPLTIAHSPDAEVDTVSAETRPQHASSDTLNTQAESGGEDCGTEAGTENDALYPSQRGPPERLIHNWMGRSTVDREEVTVLKPKQPQQRPTPSSVQNAFDRMRPPRTPAQVAEITVGDKTTTMTIGGTGSPAFKRRRIHTPNMPIATKGLRGFAMPGSQMQAEHEDDEEDGESSDEADEADEDVDGEDEEEGASEAEDQGNERQGGEDLEHESSEAGGTQDDDAAIDAPAQAVIKDSITIRQGASQEFVVQRKAFPPPAPFLEDSTDDEEDGHRSTTQSRQTPTNKSMQGQAGPIDSDEDYLDDDVKTSRDDENTTSLMQQAEEVAARPSADNLKRADQALRGTAGSKHSVLNLASSFDVSIDYIKQQAALLAELVPPVDTGNDAVNETDNTTVTDDIDKADAEAQLSLTVSKSDFASMAIAGQFNLGFIIALRPNNVNLSSSDLFIIDQHAADEKFNFERLSRSLLLDPQRLAQPKQLYLTAIEEEIILSHSDALTANGFVIETDTTGASAVGERCKLLCLPMSKETTFDLSDLEELLHLLSDHPPGSTSQYIPRPSKVRSMLAMRACRSSIMVGKTLTHNQMHKVVSNLGGMDKPWNCPHGRPTMRHLAGLGGWKAWDGTPEWEKEDGTLGGGRTDWGGWLREKRRRLEESDAEEEAE